jgi:hypothetical protein
VTVSSNRATNNSLTKTVKPNSVVQWGNHAQHEDWRRLWKPGLFLMGQLIPKHAIDAYTVNLRRSNGSSWKDEPSPDEKARCLRDTFLHGTMAVETNIFSQAGEDGILPAIFNCLGHRDKYAGTCFEHWMDRSRGWRLCMCTLTYPFSRFFSAF